MAHYPVLLEEALHYLAVRPGGAYCDCTLGAGGYAEAICERLTTGKLVAIDWDRRAIAVAKKRFEARGEKVEFYHGGFREIASAAGGCAPLAGVVADLGLSRTQIEDADRGFSFQADGPLDMRFDERRDLTAEQIVNYYGETELANLLFELGGERKSRRVARAIVRARPIRSTGHLAEVTAKAAPRARSQKIHPATRTFQALRIAVNDELGELDALLEAAPPLLEPGGRMVVVTFHSLEDARVKYAFRSWAQSKQFEILTRRVVRPSDRETQENPASRSAKLRALERKAQ